MKCKYSKELILQIANRLGYGLELVGINNRIYLIKNNERLFQKGYNQTYQYLYNKNRKKSA